MLELAPLWTGLTVWVRGVNQFFGKGENRKQVLFDNQLKLRRGEIVIMTGPSGSGKTTLLTLIGGLRSVQEGSLQVMDRELAGLGPRELVAVRSSIGFIFQSHNLFDSLTARQNVRMALELRRGLSGREMDERAVEMLSRLGLARRVHYKPQALSGGQRQRVAIARALVNRPQLVLADEPTAALDKESGAEVIKLLRQLASQEGCTILLVTHDNRILDAADRIVNMVDGHIASDMPVEQSLAICQSLVRCPVFADQNAGILTGVAQKVSRRVVPRGKTIATQGAPAQEFCVIRAGQVQVVSACDGGSALLKTLGPGDFFGEAALLTGEPYATSYLAEDDVELYTLSKEAFQEAIHTSPSFKDQLMQAFFQRQS
jgi:putative ABC transport system ATP-binding protein